MLPAHGGSSVVSKPNIIAIKKIVGGRGEGRKRERERGKRYEK